MNYEKVLGEHKFPTYEELKTGLIRLIDEGKISREDAARLLPELRESEDERITRAINNMLSFIPDEAYANNGVTKEKVDFNGEVVYFVIPCEVKPGTKIRIIYEIETED